MIGDQMIITNNLNLPKQFVSAVKKDYVYKEKRYSVTSMLKGTREILLSRRHNDEITSDVSDMIWALFGSGVHKALEDSEAEEDEHKEMRIEIEMPNGYTLSGVVDLFSESQKKVTDFKTGTVWKVIFNDWQDYRTQTLIYAYMLRKLGYEVNCSEIVLLLKDFSKTKSKTEANYPKQNVFVKHFDFTEEDFEQIDDFLCTKFEEIEKYEQIEDNAIPVCSEEERWASPTKYAVMKKGRKSAVKLCETASQAQSMVDELGSDHYIEERKGIDKKCSEYCSCCSFCSYYKEQYEINNVS